MRYYLTILIIVFVLILSYFGIAVYTNNVVARSVKPMYDATLKAVNATGGNASIGVSFGLPYLVYGKEEIMSEEEVLMVVSHHTIYLVDGNGNVRIDDKQFEIWPNAQVKY